MAELRKFATATSIVFPLLDGGATEDFEDSPVTFASGDTLIMKDEGAFTSTTNQTAHEGQGIYSLALTSAELSAARIVVTVRDLTATEAWADQGINIETYGNASAQHPFDLGTASVPQTADHTAGIADVPTVAEFEARTIVAASYFDPGADTVALVTTVTTLTGHTPQTADHTAGIADIPTVAEFNARTLAAAAYFDFTTDSVIVGAAVAGFVQDLFTVDSGEVSGGEVSGSLVLEVAKVVWDRVLTGATHNISTSAGRRLRQIEAAFQVHDGTAAAGGTNTITLDAGASAVDNIYRGDRIVIVEGTGAQEHGICISYNGTTMVATMAEDWVVEPDNTSMFEIVPADVDVETWQHVVVTTSSTSALPEVDAKSISDDATAADRLEATMEGVVVGAAEAGTLSITQMTTDLTEATNDHYIGRIVTWTTGVLAGQSSDITDYLGATGMLTYTAVTEAPSAADVFVIT